MKNLRTRPAYTRGVCLECGAPFTEQDWELRHSDPDGFDIHAGCCCGDDEGNDERWVTPDSLEVVVPDNEGNFEAFTDDLSRVVLADLPPDGDIFELVDQIGSDLERFAFNTSETEYTFGEKEDESDDLDLLHMRAGTVVANAMQNRMSVVDVAELAEQLGITSIILMAFIMGSD